MKAALFDLDGVVFDTEPQYTIFWGGIFREYNPGNDGLEEKIKGSTLVEIYEKYFADRPDVQESITQRLNDFETHMQFNYVPCFVDYVLQLRAAGVKTAIVTSSNRDKMNALYRQRPEVKDYFDAILTSEDFRESKPSPDCYLTAAARFGFAATECTVFEDSFNGLKAGRASGAYVIGLATTNSADAIAPYCDRVIADYKPLLKKG
ncbi:HAD family hydrolase [Prevotella lacticifex]|uniref:Phosphatase n=1 Tax=Prevotella lacticifex TaxID=2854755 RepID=A0A9R1CYT6_9BACT|nr:HAD family phosphatase [Prevotella lacticifex]GJG36158.1 phosphatase [Prevotella lacticifex]GJG38791.1 phosphatase [Prevotella lacticifex]GJG42527.1 phosphatase [Prevotella lacticifex]GJG45147.1 phosphatase [Prevotella lacticifex]GJG48878.1 phosphatase [Prevotella lacticifex]